MEDFGRPIKSINIAIQIGIIRINVPFILSLSLPVEFCRCIIFCGHFTTSLDRKYGKLVFSFQPLSFLAMYPAGPEPLLVAFPARL